MKLVVLIFSLFLVTSAGSAEFDWKSPLTHDFGMIAKDQPVTHTFEFKNTGEEPLVIVNAKGSCGCTVPTFTKTPILPGEKGEIKVEYNAAKTGVFRKSVTITANTDDEEVKLFVTGEVE